MWKSTVKSLLCTVCGALTFVCLGLVGPRILISMKMYTTSMYVHTNLKSTNLSAHKSVVCHKVTLKLRFHICCCYKNCAHFIACFSSSEICRIEMTGN